MVKAKRLEDGTFHIDADERHFDVTAPIALPKEAGSLFDRVQHESGYNINPKTVPVGGVLYYTDNHMGVSYRRVVEYGIVLEHYVDCVVLEKIEPADMRLVDGVPIKKFLEKCPTEWQKLPKGWSYDTSLFSVDYDLDDLGRENRYDCRRPEEILRALKDGVLVPVRDNPHVKLEADIDRHKGWRIVAKPEGPYWSPITLETVEFHNAFERYEDAQAACDAINREYKRQAALSDYEWAMEKIDEALGECWELTDTDRHRYREWLLARTDVADIEVRSFCGRIQWRRRGRGKTWMDIVL